MSRRAHRSRKYVRYVPEKFPSMMPAAPMCSGITRVIESTIVIAMFTSE